MTPLVEEPFGAFVPHRRRPPRRSPGGCASSTAASVRAGHGRGHRELWACTYGTAGLNFQVVTGLTGGVLYVCDPIPGAVYDATAIKETPVVSILAHSGGVIADKGYQGCGYVPPGKKPKGGELSVGDKRENKNISRLRAPVERPIAHLKAWRILLHRPPATLDDLPDLVPRRDRPTLLPHNLLTIKLVPK